jgi:hypothetical protein
MLDDLGYFSRLVILDITNVILADLEYPFITLADLFYAVLSLMTGKVCYISIFFCS